MLFVWALTLIICSNAFSQVTTKFIANDGRLVDDSTNARGIMLIEKVNDTAYRVHQYNMNHILQAQGVFKDPRLEYSNGEFIYYKIAPGSTQFLYHYDSNKIDTLTAPAKLYIASRGRLINGLKYGVWKDFYSDGSPQYINNLRADTAVGMFKVFYQLPHFLMYSEGNAGLNDASRKINNLASIQGNYLNGKRQGAWYSISGKGDTIGVDYYEQDKTIRSINYLSEKRFQTHVKPGHPNYDLSALLGRKISNKNADSNEGSIPLSFKLSADGKLSGAVIENLNGSLEFDKSVIVALLNAPPWKPAYLDNKAVQSEIEIMIEYSRQTGGYYQFTAGSEISYIIPGYAGY